MSFSKLFTKLSDVKQEELTHRDESNLGQSRSRKRKPESQPVSYTKRQCLRSHTARNEEQSTSEAHPYWTRTSSDPRTNRAANPSVSTTPSPNRRYGAFRTNDHNKQNTNNAGQRKKKKNKGKKKEEHTQRYKNSYRGRRQKNADFTEPKKRFMTQEFKDQHAVEIDGRLLCKYFLLGRCTKGDECQLEHIEAYNDLLKEACKFYIQGACYKGAACPYMHMSIPCKFFHTKGHCKSDSCRFSHDALTDATQKVLDAIAQRDLELSEQRKAEEAVSQPANEEQNPKEDIIISAVRPSLYNSAAAAVEDEASVLHDEPQPDKTQTDNSEPEDSQSSAAVDPEPVCYSVEAMLGPQLFKPVLYTAAKTPNSTINRCLDPVPAPCSVSNRLPPPSGPTSPLFTPVAAACELEKRAIGASDDKHKELHNVQPKTVQQPLSFPIDTASEKGCNKRGMKADETHKLPILKLSECSQDSKQSEFTTVSTKQTTIQQNRKEAKNVATPRFSHLFADLKSDSGQGLKTSDSHNQNLNQASQSVTKVTNVNQVNAKSRLNKSVECAKTPAGSFRSLFTSLDVNRDKPAEKLEKVDACSQKAPRLSQHMENELESTNSSGGFSNAEVGIVTANPEKSNTSSQNPPKGIESGPKTPTEAFQSLFTNLSPTLSTETQRKSISSSSNSKCNQDANMERPKAPTKSFTNLFAASLHESTVKNDSKIGTKSPTESMRKEAGKRKHVRETTAAASSQEWNETLSNQRPPHQSQTGHSTLFKTLFQQLKPFKYDKH